MIAIDKLIRKKERVFIMEKSIKEKNRKLQNIWLFLEKIVEKNIEANTKVNTKINREEKTNNNINISNMNNFIKRNDIYNVYNCNKREIKSSAGITLITLVITIIIIIILSAVTINATLGDKGLLKQAQLAKEMTENSTITESEKMNQLAQEYANMIAEDAEIPIKTGLEAADISKKPTLYYGAEVIGYSCTGRGVETWRIFYADESNIYLIADDCINATYIPDGKGGTPITISNDNGLGVHFQQVINDYSEGASWIKENSLAKEWLSQFLNNENYNTSTNNNIKAVAYLMDTDIWNIYAGKDAEYAIGGPTIELFCASYKDTHPSQYIECSVTNSYGYSLKWNTEEEYNTSIADGIDMSYNGIYLKLSNGLSIKWIASPSAISANHLLGARWSPLGDYTGRISEEIYSDNYVLTGICPIVCLKPNVQLEDKSDGTYAILQ